MFRHVLIALVILQTAALPSAASQVHQGKVKWWDKTKGVGFITPDNGDRDIFVDYIEVDAAGQREEKSTSQWQSSKQYSISQGACIRYQIERRLKGPVAIRLRGC